MSELRFDEQVAIITGAGGGLGRQHAIELAKRGCSILVNDIGDSADKVVDEIRALGGRAFANHHSVALESGGRSIVTDAVDQFGRVDILINNAGIIRDKAFHKMDYEQINSVIDVHLKGAFFVTQPVFKIMREQNYGRIINTTSASGLFGNFGQANYGAAKAGLAGLTRVLAIEGDKFNIKANAIAPIADTAMTAGILGDLAGRVSAQAVTPVVEYLAHSECKVNGNFYSVSGGRVARIFMAETSGVLLSQQTPEAVRASIGMIDSTEVYTIPLSLDDETALIAKALG